mgnify:CR=1 FL=1
MVILMSTKEIYLTETGLEEKKKELEYLKLEKRPQVIEALKEARALGDLSENAEYDAARTEQAEVEGRIKMLEAMLENAIIVNNVGNDQVSIGSVVTIQYDDDEDDTEEYSIVGSTEADPFENKISNESPLAQAILGSKKGDVVTVSSPQGEYQVTIREIQ